MIHSSIMTLSVFLKQSSQFLLDQIPQNLSELTTSGQSAQLLGEGGRTACRTMRSFGWSVRLSKKWKEGRVPGGDERGLIRARDLAESTGTARFHVSLVRGRARSEKFFLVPGAILFLRGTPQAKEGKK